jgi:hypothetical protein
MVAAGITGILAVVVMRIIELQTSGSKKAFQDQTITQILNEVNTYFATEVTCTESMVAGGEVNLKSEDPRELVIYSSPGNERYKKGSKIEQVEILSITARPNLATGYGKKSVFDVHMKFHRTGKNETTTVKKLKVIGMIDENGVVENCESYDNTAAVEMRRMICEDDLGGTIDIEGKCIFPGGTQGNIVKESACELLGGSFNLSTGKCETMQVDKYSIPGKGNSPAGSKCEGGEKGAVRYNLNAAVDSLEYCDGQNWGVFGADNAVKSELVVFPPKRFTCYQILDQMNSMAGNPSATGFNLVNKNTLVSHKGNWMLIISDKCSSDTRLDAAQGTIPRNGHGKAIENFYEIKAIP